MVFLLLCPRCKNRMKYESRDPILTHKRKRCVYCGYSFLVHENILKQVNK